MFVSLSHFQTAKVKVIINCLLFHLMPNSCPDMFRIKSKANVLLAVPRARNNSYQ